jgi:hypothetical protein
VVQLRHEQLLPLRSPRSHRRLTPTSFQGLSGYVTASYAELVACFGPTVYVAGARERVKVAMEWRLVDRTTGERFTVYEYKSTNRCSDHPSALSLAALWRLPEFKWNIGAGRLDLDALRAWMSVRLGREVSVVRD